MALENCGTCGRDFLTEADYYRAEGLRHSPVFTCLECIISERRTKDIMKQLIQEEWGCVYCVNHARPDEECKSKKVGQECNYIFSDKRKGE